MKNTEKYVRIFGDNLTNEQANIIKDTIGYKSCEFHDAFNEIIKEIKRILGFKK